MTAQTLAPVRKARPIRRPGSVFGYTLMGVFLAYFLIPLIWLFIASTKTNAGLFASFGLWFDKHINVIQNLKDLFARDGGAFGLWMRNTAVYAINAALGSSIISALAGYAFAQYHFKGRNLLFGIVLASVFVPGTAFAVPLYLLESKTGLSNSLLAVILPALVNPFGVYLMRIYTEQAVSQDLIDAARVDGAGELRIFATIVFRLIAPGFVTVFLFAFVGAWNNYFLPLLVLSKMNLYPVTVGLAYWNGLASLPGNAQVLYILVITGSVVAILPLMIVFLFLQRYWQAGLSLGSIRG
ncbi:MAG TPA: carbohydrate ABC transporter permease [Anaerolineales bacterium]|nr:carbohydrate ABC transporter permease [Anaerolineales bacterium]